MTKIECGRCCGTGKVGNFAHVKGGVCFACGGSGLRTKMKTVTSEKVVYYACIDMEGREQKLTRATEAEAMALVNSWIASGVEAHFETKTIKVRTQIPA